VSRPHIEFIQSLDIDPVAIAEGPFAGAHTRLLSADDDHGDHTALVSIRAGWSGALGGADRPVEIFALAGELALDGMPLGAGSYSYVVPCRRARPLEARTDAHLLVMVERVSSARSEDRAEVVDTGTLRWADRSIAAVPPGLVIKRLRDDPDTGDRTWLAALAPGWTEERAEIHPTVEEAFLIRGDGLLGQRGEMSSGCYFWRPPMVLHGPMTTRGGQLVFFRTKGGTISVTYETVPDWQRMVDDYVAREPYCPALAALTSGTAEGGG
jgi:hypothetical protein